MTEMRRITISLPNELAERVLAMRKDDRFISCSYSELIRTLAEKGLASLNAEQSIMPRS